MGIYHEVNCASVISNNVLRGNNTAMAGRSLSNGSQIYTKASKNVQI
jgi:hypothetical protein